MYADYYFFHLEIKSFSSKIFEETLYVGEDVMS